MQHLKCKKKICANVVMANVPVRVKVVEIVEKIVLVNKKNEISLSQRKNLLEKEKNEGQYITVAMLESGKIIAKDKKSLFELKQKTPDPSKIRNLSC